MEHQTVALIMRIRSDLLKSVIQLIQLEFTV